jgi:hypothetical protein
MEIPGWAAPQHRFRIEDAMPLSRILQTKGENVIPMIFFPDIT